MPLINWTKALETGHEVIDAEHRALVELLNRVQNVSRIGSHDEVLAVLNELAACTEQHFAHEEVLMDESGFAGSASHRAEHRQLLRQVQGYVDDFNDGRIVASSLALYMQRWLIHHIVSADRDLGKSLLDRRPVRAAA